MSIQQIIKTPEDCSESELEVFEKLIFEGCEVSTEGLKQRIYKAEKLIFIKDNNCVAVGALKNPNSSYKASVFGKSNALGQSLYKYELGWLYVTESARGKGYSNLLMKAILESLSESTCFATTREDNTPMHHLFRKFGFSRLGKAYKSTNGDYSLILYGKS
ncbi:GNAT family N-acetyltransferase [Microbulbifer variabilis]|uniref:GNAT family N-acetyltransferase n=1 Tax=Microbulbifer variabilis TaxID=266805 RepID=UPI00036BE75B|nr:GNAT family N-acetyltransferase [Microbulbifer variabilis]